MELIDVVAAVICEKEPAFRLPFRFYHSDRVLIAKRPETKRHGGLWEFPGGKVEPGETLVQALRREVKEELALTLVNPNADETVKPVFSIQDPGSPYRINFIRCTVLPGETPTLTEHQEYRWVAIGDLMLQDLAPSDSKFAEFTLCHSSWSLSATEAD